MIAIVKTREDLYRQFLPRGAVGAELGVHAGDNAALLYEITQPAKLYLCDPYEFPDSEPIRAKARDIARHANVEAVYRYDWDWLPTLPPQHLDWVYLDTVHQREATFRELSLLVPHLGPGGILAGHDFVIHPLFAAGVVAPVLEFVQAGALEIIALSEDFPFPSFVARILA